MLGKILFVIVLTISGSCQSMVYRYVITLALDHFKTDMMIMLLLVMMMMMMMKMILMMKLMMMKMTATTPRGNTF